MPLKLNRSLLFVTILIIVLLVVAGCGSDDDQNELEPTYETVTVETAYEQLSANDRAIIVDVREENEWRTTGIPQNARTIALSTFSPQAVSDLPQEQPIYLICNSGNRSRVAAEQLLQMGYTEVVNVDGGMGARKG